MVPVVNVPLDLIDTLWSKHWFWGRYCCSSGPGTPHSSRSQTLSAGLGSLRSRPSNVRPGSHPATTEQMLQQLAYLHLARPTEAYHNQQQQLQQLQQQVTGSTAGSSAASLHSPQPGSWQLSWGGAVGSPTNSSVAGTGASSSSHERQQPDRGLLVDAAMFKQLATHGAVGS
jgi:hypothetical protein